MKSIEIIESTVAMTFMDAVPSEEALRELVDKLRNSFSLSDDEYNQLIKRLHARLSIKMEQGAILQAEYRPWLRARSADIKPFFWSRYRDFLLKKSWAPPVVATLGQITDDILDSMGDPASDGPWTRRGLVIGDVQSGKTSTCQGRSKSRPAWRSKSRPVDGDAVVEYFVGKGLWSVAEEALPHEARAGGI
jgi:hypothetical protein